MLAHCSRSVGSLVIAAALVLSALAGFMSPAAAAPEGQLTWGVHVSLAPTWFDPAETPGIITPFMMLYALHDALVKPMPGNADGAEPGRVVERVARTGSTYEFVLRQGVRFHNGDPVTADDVKFSFERYRGIVGQAPQGARGRGGGASIRTACASASRSRGRTS